MEIQVLSFGEAVVDHTWRGNADTFVPSIHYVIGGEVECRENGRSFPLKPSVMYVFPTNSGRRLYVEPGKSYHHYYINFLMSPPIRVSCCVGAGSDEYPVIGKVFDLLISAMRGGVFRVGDRGYNESLQSEYDRHNRSTDGYGSLKQLAGDCAAYLLDLLKVPLVENVHIIRALEIIHNNYAEPLTNESIAAELHLSTHYFLGLFKSVLSVSPHVYLREFRLGAAERLMADGRNVTEAALSCGFSGLSSFSSAYKKSRGFPPTGSR